jgi:site-specific recombinase XerD
MTPGIALADFDAHLDDYAHTMVDTFNHQPSGMQAARRDLSLLSGFLHGNGFTSVTGDTLLAFLSHAKNERDNCPSSLNRKTSSIRSYVRFLRFKQLGGAEALPVEYLQRARGPYPGPVEVLSPDEVQRLLASADRESVLGLRDWTLFTLIYRLGLRLGEALAIDLSDVDFARETVLIRGKGRRQRTLPLLPDVVAMLEHWLLVRTRLYRAQSNSALFMSKKGNRLAARTAQESFKRLVSQAGPLSLDKVTPHSLRHAFASHAIDGEADPIVLKAVLGHASLRSTEIYMHPSMKVLRRAVADHPAADLLDELISERLIVLRVHQRKRPLAA